MGGLNAFHKHDIISIANSKTIEIAKEKSEGHNTDTIVGYYPHEKVLFGGCLIKELNATKGNLADAQ